MISRWKVQERKNLAQRFFASDSTQRLADSGSGKKPLRLIFALHAVFSGNFHLLMIYNLLNQTKWRRQNNEKS